MNALSMTEDYSKLTVVELRRLLTDKGVQRVSSLKKSELVNLANLHRDSARVVNATLPDPPFHQQTDLNNNDFCVIQPNVLPSIPFPPDFDISIVVSFITSEERDDSNDEETLSSHCQTRKSLAKGRRLYTSDKIRHLEWCGNTSTITFRGNVEASMKNELRYPYFSLQHHGTISDSGCNCVARADGKCSHVAALLFAAEDIRNGIPARQFVPGTSKAQVWGRGSTRAKEPDAVFVNRYNKIRNPERLRNYKPIECYAHYEDRCESLLFDLQSTGGMTMWQKLLQKPHEDYDLEPDRIEVLKDLTEQFIGSLTAQLRNLDLDHLCNDHGIHIGGTESQDTSELWKAIRKMRITGTTFKRFVSQNNSLINEIWKEEPMLNSVPAIKWGNNHEQEAILSYQSLTGNNVTRTGFFVSKLYVCIGASPDGLISVNDIAGILEVKCPWSVRDSDQPLEQLKLTFLEKDSQENVTLKKSHSYYFQVQLTMFVTGSKFAHFFI